MTTAVVGLVAFAKWNFIVARYEAAPVVLFVADYVETFWRIYCVNTSCAGPEGFHTVLLIFGFGREIGAEKWRLSLVNKR